MQSLELYNWLLKFKWVSIPFNNVDTLSEEFSDYFSEYSVCGDPLSRKIIISSQLVCGDKYTIRIKSTEVGFYTLIYALIIW